MRVPFFRLLWFKRERPPNEERERERESKRALLGDLDYLLFPGRADRRP